MSKIIKPYKAWWDLDKIGLDPLKFPSHFGVGTTLEHNYEPWTYASLHIYGLLFLHDGHLLERKSTIDIENDQKEILMIKI